ncbi:MAG: histidine phosphatase family protein [Candidatus Eremiobacteraeota bacterium]|nr:histidine phosphatase family protein [Candidatus Eremiobacteraeota bacterium]
MLKLNRTLILLLLALWLCQTSAIAGDRLIFTVVLIRHGDRTPVNDIPADPCPWKLGLGELTPLGIHQEYLLGKELRARYVDELKLLPPRYEPNMIHALSTDLNRTIMSAQSFLCGLYPPGTGPLLDDGSPALPGAYQPVPVRTLPSDQNTLLLGYEKNKEKVKQMMESLVYPTDEWKKMTATCAHKFPRWSALFGAPVTSLEDLIKPGDNLYIRLLKGVSIPRELTQSDAREIVRLYQWAMAEAFRPGEICRLVTGEFFRTLTAHMEKAAEGTQGARLVLYSAHDTTIMPVMSALGTPLDSQAPYASHICFELYRRPDGHYVKVRFNGKDLVVRGTGGKTPCTLRQFRDAMREDS